MPQLPDLPAKTPHRLEQNGETVYMVTSFFGKCQGNRSARFVGVSQMHQIIRAAYRVGASRRVMRVFDRDVTARGGQGGLGRVVVLIEPEQVILAGVCSIIQPQNL